LEISSFMPELPEVQTVVNHLAKKIVGKVFCNARVLVKKMVSSGFQSQIKNKKIISVSRRGKMLVLALSENLFLLGHLKMTGQLIFVDKQGRVAGGGHPIESADFNLAQPNKFTRIILSFTDGSRLLFHDLRKFGWMKIVDQNQYSTIDRQFGIDPLSQAFTLKIFHDILFKRPKPKIKQLLMMQELIAGIGNIYADESLFGGKILPTRPAASLRESEIKKLHQSIIRNLKVAIRYGGTSVNTFISPSGRRGRFAEKLRVYGRAGDPCFVCHHTLKRIKLAGRGTVYCPYCQK